MAVEQETNIKFVQEIENYPCLYNYKLPEYMRKNITEKAWGEIGKKFRLTGSECKEKWKNLRSVFVRHLKPPKSGSATAQKKPYYLADYMQFAIPFIKIPGNVSVNLPEPSKATRSSDEPTPLLESLPVEDTEILSSSSFQSILQQQAYLPSTISQSISQQQPCLRYTSSQSMWPQLPINPQSILQQRIETNPEAQPKANIKRKGNTFEEMQAEKDIANYFQMKQAKLMADCDSEKKSNELFLLSFLSDMNKMNDNQRRLFKRRMLDLVDGILEQSSGTLKSPVTIEADPIIPPEPSPIGSDIPDNIDSNDQPRNKITVYYENLPICISKQEITDEDTRDSEE